MLGANVRWTRGAPPDVRHRAPPRLAPAELIPHSTLSPDLSGESGNGHTYGWSAPITAFGREYENYFQWPEVTDR